MIKGYRLRLLGWIFIFGIFLDMMSTIIGVGIIGTQELNPLGFTWYLIIELILSMIIVFIIIKYYDKSKAIKIDLSKPRLYKFTIKVLFMACCIRYFVIINNLFQMYFQMRINGIIP